jgi:predicted nuclease of predicted toxin-antitoxin system
MSFDEILYDFPVITFDADFYDISLIKGYPPKIVWLRTANLTTAEIADRIIFHLPSILSFIDESDISCLEVY